MLDKYKPYLFIPSIVFLIKLFAVNFLSSLFVAQAFILQLKCACHLATINFVANTYVFVVNNF